MVGERAVRGGAFTHLPDDQVRVATAISKASWLTMMEGLWDTFHAQILHNRINHDLFKGNPRLAAYFSESDRSAGDLKFDYPEIAIEPTDFGFTYRTKDRIKTNVYQYILPWYVHHVIGPHERDDQAVQAHIPIDDEHSLFMQIMFNPHGPLAPDGYARKVMDGQPELDDIARTLPRDGRWGQDRAAMASGDSYTGISGSGAFTIAMEDIAIGESQKKVNRQSEILGPTDLVVVRARKALLDAVRAHQRGEGAFGRDVDTTQVRARLLSHQPVTA